MLTQSLIIDFFKNNISPGTTLHISTILDAIQTHFPLNSLDWAPHTTSRPTKYPRWADRVQTSLAYLKSKGIITHNKQANTYTF